MDKPMFSAGSLTNTSEGVSQTGLMGLCGYVLVSDFSDYVKIAALVAAAIGTGFYALSRGMAKKATDA